ncbi:MAG TPA: PfkB family carbohydrate kinase [Caulobacteraceae bacterium]|jgi:pyridoxine kinase|nr:PfkB family carbohydrate kinase [Caulobacteraceae bacterium]
MIVILSSHVAAGDVGGTAQLLALAGIEARAALAPTTLLGRHPGNGPPGGGPTPPELFAGMIEGLEAAGLFTAMPAMICGYMPSKAHVQIAAEAIARARAASPGVLVVVDPIMGDEGTGLYIPAEAAQAVATGLAPLADIISPNAWELQRLTATVVADRAGALAAAREWGRPVLVSSVPSGRDIGVLYADGAGGAWLATHARAATAPKGTGDILTALFTAALIDGAAPQDALETAVADVAAIALGMEAEVRIEAV